MKMGNGHRHASLNDFCTSTDQDEMEFCKSWYSTLQLTETQERHWTGIVGVWTICPKCNVEEETLSHHVEECGFYLTLQKNIFGKEKKHNKFYDQQTQPK